MLLKGNCEIACTIPMPRIDGEEAYNAFFDTLRLICQCSGKITFSLRDYGIIKPRIRVVEETDCKSLKAYTTKTVRKYEYLLVNFQVKVKEENLLITDSNGTVYNRETSIALHWSMIKESIEKCVKDMFFVLNFTSLGKIESGGFVVHCNKFLNTTPLG